MYAVIQSGGKQYRVEKDQIVDVELLGVETGSEVEFQDVLFLNDGSSVKVGSPRVENSIVKGEVLGTVKGEKITSIKYKRRKSQRTRWGHRQGYSRVRITAIES